MEMLSVACLLAATGVAMPFPKDLKPISTVGAEESRAFPCFQGLVLDSETGRLGLDFQLMIRIKHMLYIAARDHIFAVNLSSTTDNIIPQQQLTWKPKDVTKCTVRGRNSDECYNYIKVLVSRNDETLFACGTNAFNPTCRNYRMASLEQVGEELSGQARCPFESHQANVGIFAGGHFYSATMADFQASDAVMYRSLGGEGSPVLRTVKYDSKWLREPQFLHATEYGNYVYFFFREIAVEYTTLGKVVYSRVARVCKNDNGGSPRVLDGHWTSFLKARLNCSVSGESFFYFDVLQSVTSVLQINQRPAVVGVFTTQLNSIPGSAVCGFYMDEIERVFQGSFKEQRSGDSTWTVVTGENVPKPRPGLCAGDSYASSYSSSVMFPDVMLSFIKAHPLMEECVSSITNQPFLTHTSSSFKLTQIVMDTGAGLYSNHTVMFLGSDDGRVLKVLMNPHTNSSHISTLLEEIHVFNPSKCNGSRRVLGLELDKVHHGLYVAFSSCVIRVALSRCTHYRSCKGRCLSSRDPYCVWLRTGSCADVTSEFKADFDQDIDGKVSQTLDSCNDVVSSAGNHNLGLDSAPAVKDVYHSENFTRSFHHTLLIVCVLVAFVCGVVLSALLVWCYCGQTARLVHYGKECEPSIPHMLSGLMDTQGTGGSSQIYSTLLSKTKQHREPAMPTTTATPTITVTPIGCSQEVQLTGLPTPDCTPKWPIKSINVLQWKRNCICGVEVDALTQLALPECPPHNQSAAMTTWSSNETDILTVSNSQSDATTCSGTQSSALALCNNKSATSCLLPGQQKCPDLAGVSIVDEVLRQTHGEVEVARGSEGHSITVAGSALLPGATVGAQSAGAAASYYSSSLAKEWPSHPSDNTAESHVPHSALDRHQKTEDEEENQRTCPVSLSAHHLFLIKVGSGVAVARRHSFKQREPQCRQVGINSSRKPSTASHRGELDHKSYRRLVPGGSCLTRQHSYSETPVPNDGAGIRRTASLTPHYWPDASPPHILTHCCPHQHPQQL